MITCYAEEKKNFYAKLTISWDNEGEEAQNPLLLEAPKPAMHIYHESTGALALTSTAHPHIVQYSAEDQEMARLEAHNANFAPRTGTKQFTQNPKKNETKYGRFGENQVPRSV